MVTKMIYVFLLLIMIIADFQIIALYRHNRDRFEKTKDEKYLSSAKRWFAGSACGIIITLMSTVIVALYFDRTFINSFQAIFNRSDRTE